MPDKPGARGDARRAPSAPPLSLQVVTRAPSDDGSARSSRPRMRSRSSRTVCMGEELPSVRRGRQLSVPAPKPLPREIRVPGARARQTGKELLAERRSIVSGRVGICRRPVPLPRGGVWVAGPANSSVQRKICALRRVYITGGDRNSTWRGACGMAAAARSIGLPDEDRGVLADQSRPTGERHDWDRAVCGAAHRWRLIHPPHRDAELVRSGFSDCKDAVPL